MKSHKTFRSQGFTLIELLIVIAIMAITLAFGLPVFKATIASGRLTASANDMIVALELARSESIKKIKFAGVSIHADRNGDAAQNQWIVFLDSSTLTTSATPGLGTLIQSYQAANGVTVSSTDDTPTYRSDGRLSTSAPITVVFTSAGGITENRTLTISPSGRVNLVTNP
jgi:type IV fimbrial biogenesis protein FimT